ncbi:MAG: type II secretion system protein [Longibaculum sp.]
MIKQRKQLNNKGFTLVEIIVSIAIFVAVLAVLGSVLISGFKYFYETSSTDLNKRSVDELQSYIRGELIYATDVSIQDTKPEGDWYSFTIDDKGHLKHYEEKQGQEANDLHVFDNNSFYNNNLLELHVKAYQNNRLDIKLTMYDSKEELYTTRDTLELLNLNEIGFSNQAFADGAYVGDYKGMTDSNSYKIYYKRNKVTISNGESSDNNEDNNTPEITGTVYDEVFKINNTNYRGIFEENKNYAFQYGEIVYYQGKYWKSVNAWANNTTPGTNQQWKCLDLYYLGNQKSAYEKNDIVIYSKYDGDYFYQKTNNSVGWEPSITDTYYWKELGRVDDEKLANDIKNQQFDNIYPEITIERKYKTVFDLLAPSYVKWYEPNPSNVSEYSQYEYYKLGNVVKVKYWDAGEGKSDNLDYYRIYINVYGEGLKKAPGDPSSGWTLLDYRFDPGSTYLTNDIVWRIDDGGGYNVYAQAIKDNFIGFPIGKELLSEYWKVLQ